MKRTMFIGAIGCGKTTLMQRLKAEHLKYDKTQAVEFSDNFIDTPGEYIEHHQMENTLRQTSLQADIVVLLQSVTDRRLVYPQGFCTMFSRPTIGIITKIDLDKKPADLEFSKNLLRSAGVNKIIAVSSVSGENIDQLRQLLN